MKRPDLEAVLAPLKGFQRRTVDHAFHHLFEAEPSAHRFLVADEVGLGKTLVARGIIARTVEHLWETVDRIDIVYICSNGSIAGQNLDKLKTSGSDHRSFALATRLTMLATQLARREGQPSLADSKLNFVSFTPRTSFDMGHSTGRWQEREVLFHLVLPHFEDQWTPLANLFQGNLGNTGWWRSILRDPKRTPIEPSIRRHFDEKLRANTKLQAHIQYTLDTWFHRHQDHWPDEARGHRNQAIGRLRRMLAGVCVAGLEPDLVILDEFQRFKGLLETRADHRDPAAELAQALFGATTPEGNPVRTLLLSATPYKLYTADAEIEHEDHYADFLATTRFLMGGDEQRVATLQQSLSHFGGALKRVARGGSADVVGAREAVERVLRSVMARTERVSATEERDAMLEEPGTGVTVLPTDIQQYLAADALFRAVGDRDPMPFWKAAPYLPHFMRGYRFDQRLEHSRTTDPESIIAVLQRHHGAFLSAEDLNAFAEIDPGNAKLRELVAEAVDDGWWRLLWMPPTLPYWPPSGPFNGQDHRTKALLFSAWNVVPDVVSAVTSYEVERRMAAGMLGEYAKPSTQQRRLLRLAETEGRRSSHRLLLLLLPCLPLADACHPLAAPAGTDRVRHVRAQVGQLLAALPDPTEGDVDGRWEWALPFLLDPDLAGFLTEWRDDPEGERPNPEVFGRYVDDLIALDPTTLGRRPEGLEDLAVELALGAPGVLAARTLRMAKAPASRRILATDIAMAFWGLFNRPTVTTLLRSLAPGDLPYWRSVLRYCQQGNLQAVLDETWHLAWEQHAWAGNRTREDVATRCATQIAEAVRPKVSRVHGRFLKAEDDGTVSEQEVRIRTDFALRLGDIRGEDDQKQSQDSVRAAFNSPFRPFILTSTSIGQEGLDFHPWCHRIVHWNLPGNPVDLEQREGRVHRYKGHAVRRNVAQAHADEAFGAWQLEEDLWQLLFQRANAAAREAEASELVPYWLAPGPWRVQRHVPLLPWSREVGAFERLKRQLAAYRVVFGQPRQEELLRLLEGADLDTEQLRSWAIDLRPC